LLYNLLQLLQLGQCPISKTLHLKPQVMPYRHYLIQIPIFLPLF